MFNKATEHLNEVGETYWQHFKAAAFISLRCSIASNTQLIHAVFPFIKPPFGTDVCSLVEAFQKRSADAGKENCTDKEQDNEK